MYSRSRSNSRSGLYTGPLTRSTSRAGRIGVQHSASYGGVSSYSPGYLSRSGSSSTVFGRSLYSSTYSYTPPLHSVALQRSTPHYSDKYPFVRYSYGSPNVGMSILSSSTALGKDHYSNRSQNYKSYMDGTMSSYGSSLHCSPRYGSSLGYTTSSTSSSASRYSTPRSYVRYMNVDDAVGLYKNRCMTSGTLSKYWLSPTTWQNRREKEHNLGKSTFTSTPGAYSYASRYSTRRY